MDSKETKPSGCVYVAPNRNNIDGFNLRNEFTINFDGTDICHIPYENVNIIMNHKKYTFNRSDIEKLLMMAVCICEGKLDDKMSISTITNSQKIHDL